MKREFYSLSEAAQTLGISRQAVHKRIKKKKMKAQKVGSTYIISKAEVEKLRG